MNRELAHRGADRRRRLPSADAYAAGMAGPAPLLIADVPWLLYRSYFALPKSIVGNDGRPVNALLGTVNAILLCLDARLPARRARGVVACTGAEQADYRVTLYPAYHAHRDPMPPELARQWLLAPELLASLGWTVAGSDELEADDVMFSYAQVEARARGRALLVTADRDLFGAVGERVSVLELRKGGQIGEIDPAEVRRRYGVDPELVPDFIALRGDPSDGLPGAPGIGAKTAADLLREHGSLEGVLDAARPVTTPLRPRVAAALRDNAQLLGTFKRIATLQTIDVRRPPDRPTDYAGGARAAGELGMARLSERLQQLAEKSG
jgi:DNA polymerase-1